MKKIYLLYIFIYYISNNILYYIILFFMIVLNFELKNKYNIKINNNNKKIQVLNKIKIINIIFNIIIKKI